MRYLIFQTSLLCVAINTQKQARNNPQKIVSRCQGILCSRPRKIRTPRTTPVTAIIAIARYALPQLIILRRSRIAKHLATKRFVLEEEVSVVLLEGEMEPNLVSDCGIKMDHVN